MKINKTEWLSLKIVCLAAIAVMLPIVIFGVPSGNDLPQHYQFAQAYYDSVTNGDGFPSWSARENFGYGSVGIRFYPPLAYYVLSLTRMIGGSWYNASWLAFMFWMALGCGGVYFWSRWWLSPKEAALAGVFYAVFPYHLSQLYSSFVYADFAGAAILPFCFAYLTRVLEREKKSDVPGLAVAYALLVLTHLPSTIVGSLALAAYALFFLRKATWLRQTAKSATAVAAGLAASSFYWVGLISEMSWLNHAGEQYQSGHYYFANRFFPLYFHAMAADHRDNFIVSDVITSFCFLFLATAAVYPFYRRTKDADPGRAAHIFRTVLPLGLIAFLMITPLSYPIWKILAPLQKVQFPMRWMAVVSMCGSIVAAAAVHFLLKGNYLKKRAWIYTSVLFLALLFVLDFTYMLFPSSFVPIEREQFESEMSALPEKQNYLFWWSIWSKEKALEIREKVVAETRETKLLDWKSEERSFTVAPGAPTKARVATFYYPHWRADVNGSPVEVERDANGAILIPLGATQSAVRLYFEEPPAVKIASYLSLLMWTVLLLACLSLFFLKDLNPETRSHLSAEEFSF